MTKVRLFSERDQTRARELVLAGLGEHFGFIDESINPDLDDIAASYPGCGHVFLVAENGRSVVGTVGLLFETPGSARIVRMSSESRLRRTGIGTALLTAVIEHVRAHSIEYVIAHTQPEWADAVSFYRQAGFERFGQDEVDIHLRLQL